MLHHTINTESRRLNHPPLPYLQHMTKPSRQPQSLPALKREFIQQKNGVVRARRNPHQSTLYGAMGSLEARVLQAAVTEHSQQSSGEWQPPTFKTQRNPK